MNLGDVSVKNFGNDNDFIVKFEKQNSNDSNFIENIKTKLKRLGLKKQRKLLQNLTLILFF